MGLTNSLIALLVYPILKISCVNDVNDVNDAKEEIDEGLSGPLGGPPWGT